MNKKIVSISLLTILGIVFITIFLLKIFEIIYFNEKYYKIPNLKSHTIEEVKKVLENNELHIEKMGEEFSDFPIGQIFLQEPEANSIVKKDRTVKVWISKGKAFVQVPNLTGMNYLDAKVIAEQKGLILDKVFTVKAQGKYNEVLATDPNTDTLMTRGEKISFLVNGAEQIAEITMPDLIGLSFDSALNILTKNSLIVGNVEFSSIPEVGKNVIIKSSVKSGTKIPAGSAIDLTINN